MVSLYEEYDHVIENRKVRQSVEGRHSSEPVKAHLTCDLVIVMQDIVVMRRFVWPLI